MCNTEPSLASSALMALMLRRVCVLCLLAVSFCLLACQWLVTCAHARVSVSMRGYPETTSASKPALMKQQKRIPTTTAERSTILDPILWACSSESCLIVFPFCEVALCCACARCFLFVWWLVFRCETVLSVGFFLFFFFPWRESDRSPECVMKPIFSLFLSSLPSVDWSGLFWTLSHKTKYDTPKNIDRRARMHVYHSDLGG